MSNDYAKLARDIIDAVDIARRKQAKFLSILNTTIEDVRAMNDAKRIAIEIAYKNISFGESND